ncbi:MAG: exodeoxyribonuclease VII large subunit [Peptococcaceae bacterium]|nr:exodeoxyribonuclease VII large subunit [Peptococcaceae bacterium]
MPNTVTVYDLTRLVRELLEGSALLKNVWVSGEISNFKAHSSGHCYFTLKDDRSSVRCVMWRSKTPSLRFVPSDGMKVLARGSIGVFERDGTYQFYAEQLEPDGIGSLYLAYEQLKSRLEAEGLFNPSRKRQLPSFPRLIALLTSPTGAAVRDMVKVLSRRWPLSSVLVIPVIVQGAEAVPSLVAALDSLQARPEIDVAIVGRGGGSIEDLWAFNDERVARAIAGCSCPVVSAVGHESDFTIADFVADRRGETPSAAAELVVPDITVVKRQVDLLGQRLSRGLMSKRLQWRQQIDWLATRLTAASPRQRVVDGRHKANELRRRLTQTMLFLLAKDRGRVAERAGRLKALSPLSVLARGYSVTRTLNGDVLKSADQVACGESVVTTLARGSMVSIVTGKGE